MVTRGENGQKPLMSILTNLQVNHYVPDVPHILVGTKLDLRDGEKPDGYDDGNRLRKSALVLV